MFHRLISPIKSNSFFIFGARGTGKSTFLKAFFKDLKTLWFDLLDPDLEDLFLREPKELSYRVNAQEENIEWVVIDEIQKQPRLLDVVHQLIESTRIKFAMTGSSARKLKHGSANLLAGRAFVNFLYPLTQIEMKEQFNLIDALHWGTLPKVTHLKTEEEKMVFLKTYAQTYLKEEIWSEHIIRNLAPFRRFLEVAAQSNGEIINYTNISKDVGADVKTVQSYFQILEDTLIGFILDPYHCSIRKQQRMSPKFYFFDTGVQRALAGVMLQKLIPNTYAFGKTFEHFLITEIVRLSSYLKNDYRFFYLRTKEQAEIDLIIERPADSTLLIEIKSSDHVDERDCRSLERFLKDFDHAIGLILSRDPVTKKIGNVLALPWLNALQEIGLTSKI